jgi:hypothetical protein
MDNKTKTTVLTLLAAGQPPSLIASLLKISESDVVACLPKTALLSEEQQKGMMTGLCAFDRATVRALYEAGVASVRKGTPVKGTKIHGEVMGSDLVLTGKNEDGSPVWQSIGLSEALACITAAMSGSVALALYEAGRRRLQGDPNWYASDASDDNTSASE